MRLGDSVKPSRYAVELTITPGQDTFKGRIDIDVNLAQPQDTIWLNALDLKVSEAKVNAQTVEVVPGNKQVIGLTAAAPFKAGPAKIRIIYEGSISRVSSAGVFQLQEDKRWYVYTQFEPTDARRAFPCFDEPGFKVPWDIALRVPKQMMAIANTQQISETDGGSGMKLVKFATTRPLPSYLVAMGVGPFEAVDLPKGGRNKIPMRVIVPAGKKAEAAFASQAIPQLLGRLEDYFGIPYPYTKLDSLVMPISNFAMENAGLITYGEGLLLSKPDRDTIGRRRSCAVVVAHEMAHQWFGDLVTTAWWDDIWLNEAFATWMESKIVDGWKPDWKLPASEVEDRLGVMGLDSLVTSRKIRQPIAGDDDIANAFDGITYQKGAAVIKMFETWIGPDKFRAGVQSYLKSNSDKNATSPQFLAAISKAAGRDVAPAFSTFLDQAGVPVISAALKCDGPKPQVELEQKRYVPIGSTGVEPRNWQVPVCLKYEAGGKVQSQCDVLSDPRSSVTLKAATACPAWMIANSGGTGYYRTAYQGDVLSKIVKGPIDRLTLAEKLTVLGDIGPLVESGDEPVADALQIVQRFAQSKEREVVQRTMATASLALDDSVPSDLLPNARLYILDVYGARAIGLGWKPVKGETEDDRLLRESLVPFVARNARVESMIDEASDLAKAWLKDRNAIDPGLVNGVLTTAAISGDRAYFDALVAALDTDKDPRNRQSIFAALGSFRDPELVRAAMNLLLTGKYDVRESFYALLFEPLGHRDVRTLPFEFVRENLDALLAKLPREVGDDFSGSLPGVGGPVCDSAGRAQVESFFEDKVKDFTGGPRKLAQTLESIDLCIAQREKIGPDLAAFLRSFKM